MKEAWWPMHVMSQTIGSYYQVQKPRTMTKACIFLGSLVSTTPKVVSQHWQGMPMDAMVSQMRWV